MNRGDIVRQGRVVIARELAIDLRKVDEDADFRADLGADSLDIVHLTASLEDEFGIQISDDEAEFCQTVGTAFDIIESKIEHLLVSQRLDRRHG